MSMFFVDSANIDELTPWYRLPFIGGCTTNPSLIHQEVQRTGKSPSFIVSEICDAFGDRPVSVQVMRPASVDDACDKGLRISQRWPSAVVKIPIFDADGKPLFEAITRLTSAGVRVNATGCTTWLQLSMASDSNAHYVSYFWGRATDNLIDPIANLTQYSGRALDRTGPAPQTIVGSLRTAEAVTAALSVPGTCLPTVAPKVLDRLLHSAASDVVCAELNNWSGSYEQE